MSNDIRPIVLVLFPSHLSTRSMLDCRSWNRLGRLLFSLEVIEQD